MQTAALHHFCGLHAPSARSDSTISDGIFSERGCEQKMGCNRPSRLYRIHRENSASYSLKKRHICIYIRDRFFVHTYLWIHWGSADGGKRGCTPLPSFAGNASARLRRPRQNSPIPPRRLVCAAALPPSPYTKKGGALAAAARLKMSDFVNKKSPSARGVGETVTLRARGMGASCILVYSSHFLLYIISYEKEKFRSQMLN